jgi:hypothetical protein
MTLLAPRANAGLFAPGTVEVYGYGWSISALKVPVSDGVPYTSLEILQQAESQKPNKVDVDNLPDISVNLPGSNNAVKCTGDEVRSGASKCPVFTASADSTAMSFVKDGKKHEVTYQATNANGRPGLTPQIYIGQTQTLSVDLSPPSKKIKSGDTVTFQAQVTGASGTVSYAWDFGDGASKTTSQGSVSHKFTGNNQTYTVVVTVSATGNTRGDDDLSTITVGKVKKAKKKPKDKSKDDTDTNQDDSNTYDPGYVPSTTDYYDDGSGPGAGSPSNGSPAQPSPKPDRKKQDQPVTDDSGQTVTGQLIDPTATATVIPSTESPATGETEAGPAETDSTGGGGLPDGAKAALGIGALLGLGGLAEAGAFTGAFRRFRLRP